MTHLAYLPHSPHSTHPPRSHQHPALRHPTMGLLRNRTSSRLARPRRPRYTSDQNHLGFPRLTDFFPARATRLISGSPASRCDRHSTVSRHVEYLEHARTGFGGDASEGEGGIRAELAVEQRGLCGARPRTRFTRRDLFSRSEDRAREGKRGEYRYSLADTGHEDVLGKSASWALSWYSRTGRAQGLDNPHRYKIDPFARDERS